MMMMIQFDERAAVCQMGWFVKNPPTTVVNDSPEDSFGILLGFYGIQQKTNDRSQTNRFELSSKRDQAVVKLGPGTVFWVRVVSNRFFILTIKQFLPFNISFIAYTIITSPQIKGLI